MTRREFKPVVLEEPKHRHLRPLFRGRLADALDAAAELGSSLFFIVLVLGGIALMVYNLYSVVVGMAAREAWLALSCVIALGVALAFFLWVLSPIRRLIVIAMLAVLSYVLEP